MNLNLFHPICDICGKPGNRQQMVCKGKRFHHVYYHQACWAAFEAAERAKMAKWDATFRERTAKLALMNAQLEYLNHATDVETESTRLNLAAAILQEYNRLRAIPIEELMGMNDDSHETPV